ncbi:hypothetical protein JS82_06690 [Methanomassiliicoccaceae archaeon DOK]|nr:hypothetical protein JS82_06690 [Methanomassiliicoccaceae archaeon DOK]
MNGNFMVDEGVTITLQNGGKITVTGGLVTINGEVEVNKGSSFAINGESTTDIESNAVVVNGKLTATNSGIITSDASDRQIFINNGGTLEVKKNASISNIDANIAVGGTFKFNGLSDSGFTVSSYGTGTVVSDASIEISNTTAGTKDVSNLTFTTTTSNINAYQKDADGTTLIKQYMLNIDGTVADGSITLNGNDLSGYYTSEDAAKATVSHMYNDFVQGTVVIGGKLTVEDTAKFNVTSGTYVLLNGELNIKSPETATEVNTIQGTIEVVGKMTLDANAVVSQNNNNDRGILAVNGGSVNIDNNSAVDGKFAVYGAFWEDDNGITHITDLQTAITDSVAGGVTDVYICGLANSWYTGQNPDDGRGSYVISSDVTIPDDTDVTVLCGAIVAEGATVTVSADASLEFEGTWSGMYVLGKLVDHDTNINEDQMKYEVKKTTDTDTETIYTYTTLKIALSEAQSGETINLNGTVTIDENLTIPEGVTVVADGTVDDTAADTPGIIVESATFTVNGVLNMSGTQFQLTKSDKAGAENGNIVVNNYISNVNDANFINWNDWSTDSDILDGAYFNGTVGEVEGNFISSASVAADASSTTTTIVFYGKVNMGDVTFTAPEGLDQTVYIYNNSDDSAVAGTITLSGKVTVNTYNGDLTGSITAGGATISLDANKDATISNVAIGTDEETTYQMQIASMNRTSGGVATSDGAITIVSGTVYITATYNTDNMTVAEGAELVIRDEGSLIAGTNPGYRFNTTSGNMPLFTDSVVSGLAGLKVNGTVTVNGDLTADVAYINGTVNITGTGTFVNKVVTMVNGTVASQEGASASYVVGLINGTISGDVNAEAIVAYPGSDVSGVKIVAPGSTTINSTKFFVNGNEVATVYAKDGVYGELILLMTEVNGVRYDTAKFYVDEGMTDCINDFKSEGNTIYNELIGVIDGFKGIIYDAQNDTYDFSDFKEKLAAVKGNFEIGDYENIYIGMEPALVTGVISVGTGLNLYIDSLAWDPNVGYQLGVGTHVISFDVTTGYDGTNATITFNGQTVKNGGTIEITSDMTTFTLMVSGAVPSSGQVVIENGGDSGSLGLTDYLLIVLVILIVIMAIIVATRLMRS